MFILKKLFFFLVYVFFSLFRAVSPPLFLSTRLFNQKIAIVHVSRIFAIHRVVS